MNGIKLRLLRRLRSLIGPRRSTEAQRRAVLRLVAVATEERLDLPGLLEAWAAEERGGQPSRLLRLAATLRSGAPLAEAVERHPGVLGDEGNLLVRFGLESGTLTNTLRERLAEPFDPSGSPARRLRQVGRYGFLLMLIFTPIALFIQIYLAPSMRNVWWEFGLEPPAILDASGLFAEALYWVTATVAGMLILAASFRVLRWPARVFGRVVAPRLYSPLRRRRRGGVLWLLGQAADAGRPIAGAVSTLARYHYDPAIRQQLLFVRNEIALGVDPWVAAQGTRLMTEHEADAAVAALPLGVLGWTLKALGNGRRDRSDRTLRRLAAAAFPLVILVFGAFVLIQTVGLFVPLVQLNESLSS